MSGAEGLGCDLSRFRAHQGFSAEDEPDIDTPHIAELPRDPRPPIPMSAMPKGVREAYAHRGERVAVLSSSATGS